VNHRVGRKARRARLLIAPQAAWSRRDLLGPSRPPFRATLWWSRVTRAFQQFSEFIARLLPGGGDDRQKISW